MPTANEKFLSGLINHQIGMVRVSNSMRRRMVRLLQTTERDMKDQVVARTTQLTGQGGAGFALDPKVRRRLDKVEAAIERTRAPGFNSLLSELTSDLQEIAIEEPRFLRGLSMSSLKPLDPDLTRPSASELRKIVTSRPFQGRVLKDWAKTIQVDERRRIMNEIRIGLTQGQDVNSIARRIVGTADLGGRDGITARTRRDMQAVVRTAVNHISSASAREFALANRHLFSKEIWVAILDGRTSEICLDLNGKVFNVGKGRYPPAHFNCRSRRAPLISNTHIVRQKLPPSQRKELLGQFAEREKLGRIRSVSQLSPRQRSRFESFNRQWLRDHVGGVPGVQSTEDFMSSMSQNDLGDLLGVTKARLVRRGNLSIGKLVDRHGRPLTLPELASKERQAFESAGVDLGQL